MALLDYQLPRHPLAGNSTGPQPGALHKYYTTLIIIVLSLLAQEVVAKLTC